jgi:hypothetical protein
LARQVLRLRTNPTKWKTHGVFIQFATHYPYPQYDNYILTLLKAYEIPLKSDDEIEEVLQVQKEIVEESIRDSQGKLDAGVVVVMQYSVDALLPTCFTYSTDDWNSGISPWQELDHWEDFFGRLLLV